MRRILLLFLILSLSISGRAYGLGSDFRNQFSLLGYGNLDDLLGPSAGLTKLIQIATQFGNEWVIGEPYDWAKANAAVNAGLKVMYNSNNARVAKWIRFNNPCNAQGGPACGPEGFSAPTGLSIGGAFMALNTPLAIQVMGELETALCMTSWGMTSGTTQIYNPATGTFKYQLYKKDNKNVVLFVPNYRNNAGIAAAIAGEMRTKKLHEDNAGKPLYSGLYIDETRFEPPTVVTCPNASSPNASYDVGRKKFTLDLRAAMQASVEAKGLTWGGTSGNPWTPDPNYAVYDDPGMDLEFIYNEASGGTDCDTLGELQGNFPTGCGNQNTGTWAPVPINRVQVGLSPTNYKNPPVPIFFQRNYPGAALIMGRAAGDAGKPWSGWFVGPITPAYALTSIFLLRAIPTWDNLRVATSRIWNESTDIYTSSNSFISQTMAYSRHKDYEVNHKLFVTRNSGTPTITLNSNEKVVNAKCTDFYFTNETDCVTGYFTQASNTVSLGANIVNGNGYVLIVHRQPSFKSAKVLAADQLDVCWNTDDTFNMIPATATTGWTVTVAGTPKTVQSSALLNANCFRLLFAPGTITSSAQAVTVAYSGGNVTSGTSMINGSTKVAAATFTTQTAQNTLGGGNGGDPILTQTKYQWQNNVGSADGAPLYGALNGQLAPSPGGQARLIVKVRNTVNAQVPTQLPLCFVVDPVDPTSPSGGAPLTDSCAGNQVCYTHALGISSLIPSTELLASDEATNVACGVIQSQNEVPLLTLPAASEAECIYAIRFKEDLTAGQKVYFYPSKDSGLLDAYTTSNLPHATVQAPRSDQINGTYIGGTYK